MLHAALLQAICSDLSNGLPLDFRQPGHNIKDVRAQALQTSLLKKFLPESTTDLDKRAEETFHVMNNHCANFSLDPWKHPLSEILFATREEIWKFFYDDGLLLDQRTIEEGLDFGPGASYRSLGTSLVEKLVGPIAGNEFSIAFYKSFIGRHPVWLANESTRCKDFGEPIVEAYSKISFVPKNEKTSRSICVEPALNMLVQKGIASVLLSKIRSRYGIDIYGSGQVLSQSDCNRALAREGSKNGTFATIDLQSSSDSISMGLVEFLFPPNQLAWIKACSCRNVRIGQDEHKLNMISTMGNAITFPLQILIYTAMLKSVYHFLNIPFRRNYLSYGKLVIGNFGVFGDDIIVATNAAEVMIDTLRAFGMIINDDKTFVDGPFRESCGLDCYNGLDVRGVYIKRLKSRNDIFVAYNLLRRWSDKHSIPLCASLQLLRESTTKPLYIPAWMPDTSGFKVSLNEAISCGVRRVVNTHTNAISYLYRCSAVKAREIRWEEYKSAIVSPYGPIIPTYYITREFVDRIPLYENAFYLSFLRGNLRDGALNRRDDEPKYHTITKLSPNW